MIDTRKQASNGFGKGLNMDASIFNLDNNTLSNCLNGTTITCNGNEFILLNDMGNGRVESAFLPAGYVPIGMKEYGGIIYVASYNPFTKKGLIGSFPSPERNIADSETGAPNLQINPELFSFDPTTGMLKFYAKLKILEGDKVLRPGDKFSLQYKSSTNVKNLLEKLLTNFSTSGNRLFKIGVAVMDAEGNLEDITDLLKTLDGYFIFPYSENSENIPTVDTIRNSVSNANIYGGRLVGKLFLTVEVNTPIEYEIEIDGEKLPETDTSKNNFKVNFKGKLKDVLDSNDNYYFKGIKAKLNGSTNYLSGGLKQNGIINHEFSVTTDNSSTLSYELTPCMLYGELKTFTKKGTIDLSLLNSGNIELTEWKYYNDFTNDTLYLNWGLVTYLRNKEYIKSIDFNFYEYDVTKNIFKNPIKINTDSRKNYTGNFTEEISYSKLPYGSMYLVQICINKSFKDSSLTNEPSYFYRILYTSSYFNKLYYSDISDFKNEKLTVNINTKVENSPYSENLPKVTEDKSATTLEITTKNPDFYIKKYEENSLNTTFKLDYEVDNKSNLPISLNKEYNIKIDKYTIKSLCEAVNINRYKSTNFTKSNFAIDKLKDNKIPEKTIEDSKSFWYSNEIKDDTLNIHINTVTEYKGIPIQDTIHSNKKNYIPYLNDFTPNRTIFGYDVQSTPDKGFATAYGGRHEGDDNKRAYANFIEVNNWNNFSFSYIGDENQDNFYPTGTTNYGSGKMPEMNDLLHNLLKLNYKKQINNTLPVILFWIAADVHRKMDKTNYAYWKDNVTENNNYIFVVWKDSQDKYYLINNVFTKSNSEKTIEHLKNLFKNLYIEQNYSFSKDIYKAGEYSYLLDYGVKYSAKIKVENALYKNDLKVAVEDLKPEIYGKILNFDATTIINTIKANPKIFNNINTDDIRNNITIENLNINPLEDLTLEKTISGGDINEEVSKYIILNNSIGKALLTFNGTNVNKLYLSDFLGGDLNAKIYYLSEDKAYPITNLSGFEKSTLALVVLKDGLLNLDTSWDPENLYTLIVINPIKSVNLTGNFPCIGNVDNHDKTNNGYMRFSEGKIIDLSFTQENKIK